MEGNVSNLSSASMRVEIEELAAAAPTYSKQGDDLGNAVKTAADTLYGLGNFWGNDDPGTKFGSVYKPQEEFILGALAMIAGGLHGIADGITKMSEKYHLTEAEISSGLHLLDENENPPHAR